ncbi:hypothetical protein EG329_000886 [Mollisiaceae sp. DMI_Dod_QoI]|nr:hypothetical protein EG329_000886 [Helotiales sp. DMI_Dod_QoI]
MTCVLQANIGDSGEFMIDGGFHYPCPLALRRGSTALRLKPYPLEKDGILLPLAIVESIVNTRRQAIEQILTAVYDVVEKFEGKKEVLEGRIVQSNRCCSFECDAINFGFLVKGLQQEGLWPRPSTDDIRMSIHDLAKTLYRIAKFTSLNRPPLSKGESPARDHKNCFPPSHLSSAVMDVLSNVSTLVLDSHKAYMDTACLEVGLLD